jgi:hypothetical protein
MHSDAVDPAEQPDSRAAQYFTREAITNEQLQKLQSHFVTALKETEFVGLETPFRASCI